LFASEEFIVASRKFVCIRIETFENKESEAIVRELLNGRFANTAFTIFDPDGKRRLTRSGRSPTAVIRSRGGRKDDPNEEVDDKAVIREMNKIAKRFEPVEEDSPAVLQDFHSFRQALNVASADQRLLVFVNLKEEDRARAQDNFSRVFSDTDIVGKFHLNFADPKVDGDWAESIKGDTSSPGIFIIRSGTFGQDGVVMQKLPKTLSVEELKSAMVLANDEYSIMETRKTYSQHVMAGKRAGIHFENEISSDGTSDGRKRGESRRGGNSR